MTMTEPNPQLTFEAPGGGSWMLDTTHHGRRPVSRYLQPLYTDSFPPAMEAMIDRFGLPLAEFRAAIVNGCMYFRPVGVGEPENPKGGPPPLPVMKVLARVHPGLRRRNRVAREAWAERRWREDVDRWFDGGGRDEVVAANLVFQEVDVAALDDGELADHLADLGVHFREQAFQSGATHGGDIIPVGDYLAHCRSWGIDPSDAAGLLAGASPASVETAAILAPVGRALDGASTMPASVEEVRALGADVAAAVDEWLRIHGHRLLTSDDIDGETLVERPDLQLKALLSAPPEPVTPVAPDPGVIRSQVPAGERARFDELLAEARYGLRLRDDNVGVRWNWTAGLIRRGVIEAGRRLAARNAIEAADQVIELDAAEVAALLRREPGPGAEEIAERWTFRQLVIDAEPPLHLGPDGGEPPVEAFPPPLSRATGAMLALIEAMNGVPAEPLSGAGIGGAPITGRAVVVRDVVEALERVEPGDVVVAPYTGPAWSPLLPALGGLVVEEGGPMSHAAIVAREYELPTVVGVAGATSLIPDGAQITVDPAAGRITLD